MISRVGAVHRSLAAMFEETRAAFRDGDEAEAAAAFARLREELEAHFEKEDRLYYPAIRALRPDRAEAVNRVGTAHQQFVRRFELIVEQIQAGKLGRGGAVLRGVRRGLHLSRDSRGGLDPFAGEGSRGSPSIAGRCCLSFSKIGRSPILEKAKATRPRGVSEALTQLVDQGGGACAHQLLQLGQVAGGDLQPSARPGRGAVDRGGCARPWTATRAGIPVVLRWAVLFEAPTECAPARASLLVDPTDVPSPAPAGVRSAGRPRRPLSPPAAPPASRRAAAPLPGAPRHARAPFPVPAPPGPALPLGKGRRSGRRRGRPGRCGDAARGRR